MPIYEYRCDSCGDELEALQRVSNDVLTDCPECETPELKKLMSAAGFRHEQLIRATIYVTEPGQVVLYRKVRDEMLAGHRCANTYLEISALADPGFLVEIEGEAVRE